MVSVNRTPAQGFYFFDPMNSMEFHHASNANSLPPSTTAAAAPKSSAASGAGGVPCAEDHSKKVRKPYTITKSRENWTEQEHDKFLEALHLFDRDWKKIEAFVGSKTVIQIRSHAQKYFLKVQKSGTSEHVPPPRPKRKAAHPYPQKAPKNALVVSLVNVPFQTSSALYEPGYIVRPDGSALLCNPHASAALPSWSHDTPSAMSGSQVTQDDVQTSAPVVPTYSSSNDSTPRSLRNSQAILQGDQQKRLRVMPDFARVYRFIGSVFDPNSSGHMQRLKQMDPIDLETALLLMRNLCVNLMSPEFEVHRRLLASYDGDPKVKTRGSSDLCSDRSESITLSA